jgi:predicted small metal-binding protein
MSEDDPPLAARERRTVEPEALVLDPHATQQPYADRPRQSPDPFQPSLKRRFVVCHRPEERPMTKVIKCDCGRVVRGDTDDELVAAAQKHAREAHGMDLTRDQVLSLAVPE